MRENSTTALSDLVDPSKAAQQLMDSLDPAHFARSLLTTGLKALANPVGMAEAVWNAVDNAAKIGTAVVSRVAGTEEVPEALTPAPGDRRFTAPAWQENLYFYGLQQAYLLGREFTGDVIDAAQLEPAEDRKTRFAAGFVLDALAPTNRLFGNPEALDRAIETRGASFLRGVANMLDDVRHNGGWPSKVDDSGFAPGRNMAMTPGKVVYRNDLMELIQYAPQTEQVYEVPLLFCPPWINKYYIMDLAPGKSLIEWAVRHNHTCFTISYRNPDESMRDVTFEDYLRQGPLEALRVVQEITGAQKVNTANVCLGGTLTAIAMAYGAATGSEPIHTATFLNTLVDFTDPGVLGAFTDEPTVAGLERKMAKKGYLEADDMALTFDAIRAQDLIFQYVTKNWLMGEDPPAFDLLAWNNDSTRMPAKMHSSYLRRCYLDNEFARDVFKVDGTTLRPDAVQQDTYVLAAVDDHIVPWQSGYRTAQLLGGHNRFVLSSSGHIAGIVNPPSPKARHWVNENIVEDPADWLTAAEQRQQAWWEDWATWIGERAGELGAPPASLGSPAYPPGEDAPGSYVLMRPGDGTS